MIIQDFSTNILLKLNEQESGKAEDMGLDGFINELEYSICEIDSVLNITERDIDIYDYQYFIEIELKNKDKTIERIRDLVHRILN